MSVLFLRIFVTLLADFFEALIGENFFRYYICNFEFYRNLLGHFLENSNRKFSFLKKVMTLRHKSIYLPQKTMTHESQWGCFGVPTVFETILRGHCNAALS